MTSPGTHFRQKASCANTGDYEEKDGVIIRGAVAKGIDIAVTTEHTTITFPSMTTANYSNVDLRIGPTLITVHNGNVCVQKPGNQ